MANVIKMLLSLRIYASSKHFPKNLRFSTVSFNQANDVYVKIYETAQLRFCFLNQKRKIHVNFANVLWVAFSIPSGSSSLAKYPVYIFC
jgi:hypothetical protein